jgi:copper chaperone
MDVVKEFIMKSHELTIQGMSCGHCVMHVKQALDDVDGLEVEEVQVGKARVWYDDETIAKVLSEKVEEAGYKVVSIQ